MLHVSCCMFVLLPDKHIVGKCGRNLLRYLGRCGFRMILSHSCCFFFFFLNFFSVLPPDLRKHQAASWGAQSPHATETLVPLLGRTFRFFFLIFFFSSGPGEMGSPRRQAGEVICTEDPRWGGLPGGGGTGRYGVCGEFRGRGGGLIFFFRGRKSHQDCKSPGEGVEP